MNYVLNEKEIEQILKEGKFDEEKYIKQSAIIAYTIEDSIYEFMNRRPMPLLKNKNILYENIKNLYLPGDLYNDISENIIDLVQAVVNVIEDKIEKEEII